MHHSAGWYGEICGAAVLLGFVGYHTFKGLWSSAEKYVFQSVQEEVPPSTRCPPGAAMHYPAHRCGPC